MELDWSKVLDLDWTAIDTLIFKDKVVNARRIFRQLYTEKFKYDVSISDSSDVISERFVFLDRYQRNAFPPSTFPSLSDQAQERLSNIDIEKNRIIYIHGEWNVPSRIFLPVVPKMDHLVLFVQYVPVSGEQNLGLVREYELLDLSPFLPTHFDPDFIETYSDVVRRAEEIIKPLALQLGVTYSIQPEPASV